MNIMDTVIYHGAVTVTGWTLCGWSGALCFGGRWVVQAWHRRRTHSAVIPLSFWLLSLVGATLTLTYFIFGATDSVGIVQNLLPMGVAGYNVWLDLGERRRRAGAAG